MDGRSRGELRWKKSERAESYKKGGVFFEGKEERRKGFGLGSSWPSWFLPGNIHLEFHLCSLRLEGHVQFQPFLYIHM